MVWDNFKIACKERGTSATQALKDLGISQSMPSKWKNGASPREETIKRMADYLGITVSELVGDASTLTAAEQELLSAFRHLPPASQEALLALVKSYDEAPGGGGHNK